MTSASFLRKEFGRVLEEEPLARAERQVGVVDGPLTRDRGDPALVRYLACQNQEVIAAAVALAAKSVEIDGHRDEEPPGHGNFLKPRQTASMRHASIFLNGRDPARRAIHGDQKRRRT